MRTLVKKKLYLISIGSGLYNMLLQQDMPASTVDADKDEKVVVLT